MFKRIFTLLIAFLAITGNAVWAEENPQTLETDPYYLKSGEVLRITKDGTYYVKSNGRVTNSGIRVEGSDGFLGIGAETPTPTIVLLGVDIQSGGSSIIIDHAEPTFIIYGENSITSTEGSDAAIQVNTDAKLTVSSESTGILEIVMPESSTRREMIAIGTRGTDNLANPIGLCGSVTLEGGTIKTNGYFGDFDTHGFRFQENAVVIVKDIEGFNYNSPNLRQGGLLYKGDEIVGEFHNATNDPDLTLNSPLPEPYKIEVRSGGVEVTIGEGQSLTESQVDLLGGTLNAYKVVYDINKPANLTDVNPATVPSIYCGASTPLATIDPTLNPADTYHYFGWANGNNITMQTASNTPNQVENVDAKAVWVVASKKVTAEKGSAIEAFSLIYPETVTGINFTLAENTSLPGALTNSSNKISGTLNDSGTTKYTASYGEKSETVTLTFEAMETKIDLEEEDAFLLQIKDLTYNGSDQTKDVNVQVLDVAEGNNLDKDANYTVSYEPSVVKDAGQYTVTVTGKGAYEGTLTGTFNVNKADAKVIADDVVWTIGEGEGPDFSEALSATGVGEDKLTVASFTDPTGTWDKAGVYKVTYTDIKLNNDLAGNYNEVSPVDGTLTVKKTGGEGGEEINPGDPNDDETEIIPGTDTDQDGWEWVADKNRYERTYDGEPHPLSTISLKYKNEEGETAWETLSLAKSEFSVNYTSEPVKNVAENGYTATITITGSEYYSGTATMILYINPRPIDVNVKPFTVADLDKKELTTDMVTFEEEGTNRGLVEDEPAGVSGTISVVENASAATDGMKHYTVTFSNLQLENSGDNTSFLATNYTPTFKYGDQEITDAGIDVPIGDVEPGGDTEIDDGDGDDVNNWSWSNKGYYEVVYDGEPHGVASVTVTTDEGEAVGTVTEATYTTLEGTSISGDEPVDAGYYTANVIIEFEGESKTGSFPLCILPRPLGVNFDLSGLTDDYAGETLTAISYVKGFIEVVGESVSGPLEDEEPAISQDGKLIIADAPNSEGSYPGEVDGVVFAVNGEFMPSNYNLVPYINGIRVDDYDKETGDGSYGDEDEGGISFDPNKDNQGDGIHIDRPKKYYNIYIDTICPGLNVEVSKDVVQEGHQVSAYLTIQAECDTTGMRFEYKRGLFGYWKDLKKLEGVQPGEYIIKNIYTDIYIRALDATLPEEEPTGIEDVEGAKAYAKDGSIYVYTPSREQVTIISMSGAIIKNEEQVGLQSYSVSRGIYIVRIGDKVFKLKN